MEVKMEHVKNLNYDSDNLDVIVKGKVTGKSISTEDKVLYQIETDEFDKFEADERCVYHDVTKPVVVKQFVADWYEEHKDNLELNLYRAIDLVPSNYRDGEFSKFEEWLVDEHTTPFQTLVNMHQFGYEVEKTKEKRYIVRIKSIMKNYNCLNFDRDQGYWVFANDAHGYAYGVYHTKKELEDAGFGGVFDNPLFEIEEVEE